jgi:CHAT domain-containing protein
LLEISLSDAANSYAWEVTTETLRGVKLPSRTEIEAAARRLLKSITAREIPRNENPSQKAARLRLVNDFAGANSALSQMVLEPLGGIRPGQRLLIVTDGLLDLVPFTSLLDPKTGFPLIAYHEVVRIPSASALAVLREGIAARKTKTRDIAILADPVFDAHDERFAASLQPQTPVVVGALSRSITETGLTIPRLVYSQAEAKSIVEAAPRGSTFVKKGFEANRDFVANGSLAGFRIVHFATHGLVDMERPALSGIVLSLVDSHGRAQDGFLRLHDIYNLHLNADLVVLSACETALGSQVEGEGVMSLSRGFFYAGAASVMASLWKVDDRATAELMGDFYRNLLSKHMTPTAALNAAQLKMRQSSQWSNPYYWAAFELQGEWK